MKRCACSAIAATTFGWAWPVDVTAMPPEKSRYCCPLVVVTHDPVPDATSRSVTENHTPEICDPLGMPRDYVTTGSPEHGHPPGGLAELGDRAGDDLVHRLDRVDAAGDLTGEGDERLHV